MTWTNIQYLIAENYYRSGIRDDERETIIELPSPEYLETISNIKNEFSVFRNTTDIGLFDFTSINVPGIGKVRINISDTPKIFFKADVIWPKLN